jgi:hypothetical protein
LIGCMGPADAGAVPCPAVPTPTRGASSLPGVSPEVATVLARGSPPWAVPFDSSARREAELVATKDKPVSKARTGKRYADITIAPQKRSEMVGALRGRTRPRSPRPDAIRVSKIPRNGAGSTRPSLFRRRKGVAWRCPASHPVRCDAMPGTEQHRHDRFNSAGGPSRGPRGGIADESARRDRGEGAKSPTVPGGATRAWGRPWPGRRDA